MLRCCWMLYLSIVNPTTYPWMKQSTWLRIVHSGDGCIRLALCNPSGACHKRRRLPNWGFYAVTSIDIFVLQCLPVTCWQWWKWDLWCRHWEDQYQWSTVILSQMMTVVWWWALTHGWMPSVWVCHRWLPPPQPCNFIIQCQIAKAR